MPLPAAATSIYCFLPSANTTERSVQAAKAITKNIGTLDVYACSLLLTFLRQRLAQVRIQNRRSHYNQCKHNLWQGCVPSSAHLRACAHL